MANRLRELELILLHMASLVSGSEPSGNRSWHVLVGAEDPLLEGIIELVNGAQMYLLHGRIPGVYAVAYMQPPHAVGLLAGHSLDDLLHPTKLESTRVDCS